jgi:molybdopterin molybdotransferase
MVETVSWLKAFGFPRVTSQVAPDQADHIRQTILDLEPQADAFITSGGAWGSERDLMPRLLVEMGWKGFFHRVRLGPGKAAGFGLLDGRPFFILPGGPPSHEAAFLLLALPGLLAMAGFRPPFFPETQARLVETVEGPADWTQVVHAVAVRTPDGLTARPVRSASRLGSMARKNALFLIPEGVSGFDAGNRVPLMLLIPGLAGHEPLF